MSDTYHALKELRHRYFNGEISGKELTEEALKIEGKQLHMAFKPKGGEEDANHKAS